MRNKKIVDYGHSIFLTGLKMYLENKTTFLIQNITDQQGLLFLVNNEKIDILIISTNHLKEIHLLIETIAVFHPKIKFIILLKSFLTDFEKEILKILEEKRVNTVKMKYDNALKSIL